MKRAMQNAMRFGAQGIKIMSAGRLNGAEIARTEWYREGRVPLHCPARRHRHGVPARTTYGIIGIRCGSTGRERWSVRQAPSPPDAARASPAPRAPLRSNSHAATFTQKIP